MGRYVDGFVLPVPEDKVEAYRELAAEAGQVWVKHGALEYVEGIGDDMEPDTDEMPMQSFPSMVGARDGETVVFAFIVFESRQHRDEVNQKVMQDPAMEAMDPETSGIEMPFDPERMVYGGFRSLVAYDA